MILVFGGTTEGKKVATLLASLAMPFVYSTKTKIAFPETAIARYRHGALDEKQLQNYLTTHHIHTIINAAHPFAVLLHSTIAQVGERMQIPVIRFGRELLAKKNHPLVDYVNSYEEALALLKENQRLLALTGVQSIQKLKSWWQQHTTYFRILDRPVSLAMARAQNFPDQHLILGLPSANLEKEMALIKAHTITIILTKETGNSGFLSTKIEAALRTNTKIIIIKQPKTPAYFKVVYTTDALEVLLSKTGVV